MDAQLEKITIQGKVVSAFTYCQAKHRDNRYFVSNVSAFHSALKPQRIVTIEATDGRVYKTFTTASWAWEINEGDSITATATIKGESEYKGQSQTLIKNVKVGA